MTQSVELLLDPDAERRVREEWALLETAGLASQARHRAPSNRPHVTLAAVTALAADAEPGLVRVCEDRLPLPARLGALAVFGRDPVVLVRLVVADAALLALHREVAVRTGVPPATFLAPGRWTPHVTLAHRMPRAQLPAALEVLPVGDVEGTFTTARRWDGDARREWPLTRTDRAGFDAAGPGQVSVDPRE